MLSGYETENPLLRWAGWSSKPQPDGGLIHRRRGLLFVALHPIIQHSRSSSYQSINSGYKKITLTG
nr:MAG TPA_asm: hypothetical protein [Caudoviricetes sp.]